MSYRNSDGSITLEKVCMTAATYQHIHDSVMVDYGAGDIIKATILVDNPIKRDELYRKLVFEAYAEYVEPLGKWVYRGSEENARDLIWISNSNNV